MSMLFRRPSSVTCFFCLSLAGPTSNVHNFDPTFFRCPACGCLNRYDEKGRIINEEPAMYNERLNSVSFSKRGVPNPSHSLSAETNSPSIFCRTCQTNQMLLINLRAAYLPAQNDPAYGKRLQNLPEYMASLQTRYPPVCSLCQPAVDEEISRKNEFARTRALAGALKTGRPPARKGRATSTSIRMRSWKIRGLFWFTNTILMWLSYSTSIFNTKVVPYMMSLRYILPFLELVALLWAFWDPTYSLQFKSRVQGRPIRVEGRKIYIVLQGMRWVMHLVSSSLLCYTWIHPEYIFLDGNLSVVFLSDLSISKRKTLFIVLFFFDLLLLTLSYFSITIHKPASIRLIDSSAYRGLDSLHNNATPMTGKQSFNTGKDYPPKREDQWDRDIFSNFSLSSNPVVSNEAINPMFGKPSLLQHLDRENEFDQKLMGYEDEEPEVNIRHDPDAMDWEPVTPYNNVVKPGNTSSNDGTLLRPQRFFPPEEPTGLEHLLMRTRILDDGEGKLGSVSGNVHNGYTDRWNWVWVYSISSVPVAALLIGLWLRS